MYEVSIALIKGVQIVNVLEYRRKTKTEVKKTITDAVKIVDGRAITGLDVNVYGRSGEADFEGAYVYRKGWTIHTDENLGFREGKSRNPSIVRGKGGAPKWYYHKQDFPGKTLSQVISLAKAASKKEPGTLVYVVGDDGNDHSLYLNGTLEHTYKKRNPLRKKGGVVRRSIRGLKDHINDIGGKIVGIGKDSITILAPKGTTAKLMSNPGVKGRIKNVQMGITDRVYKGSFQPIRASWDYDPDRLEEPEDGRQAKSTTINRAVQQINYAQVKIESSTRKSTIDKWKKIKAELKGELKNVLAREGYKGRPKWVSQKLKGT